MLQMKLILNVTDTVSPSDHDVKMIDIQKEKYDKKLRKPLYLICVNQFNEQFEARHKTKTEEFYIKKKSH